MLTVPLLIGGNLTPTPDLDFPQSTPVKATREGQFHTDNCEVI